MFLHLINRFPNTMVMATFPSKNTSLLVYVCTYCKLVFRELACASLSLWFPIAAIYNKHMASVGADSSESKLIFVLPGVLNVGTALPSRANCSCLPAMIDLNHKHVRSSIIINNQQYIMHLIKCMCLICGPTMRVYGNIIG